MCTRQCKERLPIWVKILRFWCPSIDVLMHETLKFLLIILEVESSWGYQTVISYFRLSFTSPRFFSCWEQISTGCSWRFCTFGITGKELILTVFGWESGSPMPLSFFCERHRSKWESRHSTLRQMLSDERSHTLFFVFFHAIFLSYCIWSPSRFLLIDMTKTWHTQLLFSAFFSLKKNYNQSKFFYLVKAKYLSL